MEKVAGPIPGENFTSDTKNYPWHRPPEFDDLDKAIEYSSKKLTAKNTSISMMTLAKNDIPISTITEIFLMGGIQRGKWTPDYALLMAGPVAHTLVLMAKASGIKYNLGIDEDAPQYTDAFFKAMRELDDSETAAVDVMSGVVDMSLGGDPEEMPEDPGAGEEMPPEGPETPTEPPQTGFAGAAAGMAPPGPSAAPEAPVAPDEEMMGM